MIQLVKGGLADLARGNWAGSLVVRERTDDNRVSFNSHKYSCVALISKLQISF